MGYEVTKTALISIAGIETQPLPGCDFVTIAHLSPKVTRLVNFLRTQS
jgi:hypothetical protein